MKEAEWIPVDRWEDVYDIYNMAVLFLIVMSTPGQTFTMNANILFYCGIILISVSAFLNLID